MTKYVIVLLAASTISGCTSGELRETAVQVKEFCAKHGGFGQDLTDDVASEHGAFVVQCADGAMVSGYVNKPDLTIYRNKDLEEVDN